MDQSAGTPTHAAASPPTGRVKRRWFRFSLRTLLIFVLLIGSAMGLWWNWEPWRLERVLGNLGLIGSVDFSPDGGTVIAAGDTEIGGRGVKAWDSATGRELFELPVVFNLAWPPSSTGDGLLVTVNADYCVALRDGRTGAVLCSIDTLPQRIVGVTASPDGRTVATLGDEEAVRFWDTASARPLWSAPARSNTVFFSPDSRLVVLAPMEDSAVVFEARTGARLAVLDPGGTPYAAMFSRDGKAVLTSRWSEDLKLWNVADGSRVTTFSAKGSFMRFPRVSPDGQLLLVAEPGGTVQTWSAATGALCATVQTDDTSSESALCFSPDSRRILVAFHLSSARLWDARDGRPLFTFTEGPIAECAAFSPDGRRIAMGRKGGGVEMWVKRRDESPFGILILPQFWLTLLFGSAFVWSVFRDRRTL